jgi:hypothetical protein
MNLKNKNLFLYIRLDGVKIYHFFNEYKKLHFYLYMRLEKVWNFSCMSHQLYLFFYHQFNLVCGLVQWFQPPLDCSTPCSFLFMFVSVLRIRILINELYFVFVKKENKKYCLVIFIYLFNIWFPSKLNYIYLKKGVLLILRVLMSVIYSEHSLRIFI